MKLPPHGKPLHDFLLAGHSFKNDFVYLYVGDKAWEEGKKAVRLRPLQTLVLPPNYLATTYRWPVRNCDILIIQTNQLSQKYMENIVLTLFAYKAKTIISFLPDENITTFYEKDFQLCQM